MFKQLNTANFHLQHMLSYIKHECREREKRSASFYNFDFIEGHPQEAQEDHPRFEWKTLSRPTKKHITKTPPIKRRKRQGRVVSLFNESKSAFDNTE